VFLPRLSIERPVFATVVSLLIVVLGIGAALRLPVRELPDVDPPTVLVTTVYPGAAAEVVEREVTEPIEERVASIEGIDTVTATSRDEFSRIEIQFQLYRDLDAAAADVRDKIGEVRAELPEEAEEPVIAKTAGGSQAMMWLTLQSDLRDRLELSDFTERNLVDPLSVVRGVGRVLIGGERRYAMRIWLDPEAMAVREVTVDDVIAALREGNVELPAGRIESEEREFTVRATTELDTARQFRDLIVRDEAGYQVTLGEVAEVEVGAEDYRTLVRRDGEPAVGVGIVRQSKANTLAVANGVLAEIERLRPGFPEDVEIDVAYNEALFIRGSLQQVGITLAITAGLVIAVLFFFLRSLRTVLIPAVTIPVSLVGTFIILLAFGYSINTLTLLALVLAVGLVVDDAIVVTENIFRRNEEGEPRLLAAARGGAQISFAVIATSLVLISVFVPLAFMTGTVGRLFTEFAVALAAAVAFSSLVALTLGPMLGSRLVDAEAARHSRFYRAIERGFAAIARGYRRLLEGVVKVPLLVVGAAVVLSGGLYVVYQALPQELAPTEDRGFFIIPVQAPEGASLDYTLGHVERIEQILAPLSGDDGPIDGTISIIGAATEGPAKVDEALVIVRLEPWGERALAQQEILARVLPEIAGLAGVQAFAVNPPSLGVQGFEQPVQFVIAGPTYDAAQRWARQVFARAQQEVPGLTSARLDYKETKSQVQLSVDRHELADLGLSVRQVGEALRVLLGELDVTDYAERGETYEVMLRAVPEARDEPGDLENVYLRAESGELVQLSGLVEREAVGAPAELTRVDRLPAVTLKGSLAEGAALGDVLAELDRIAAEIVPPAGRISYLGRSQEYQQSSAGLYITFALALVIVFLVLAAQFESFVQPVTIMTAVPLAITGGLLAMWLFGISFNIFSQIGLILLIGLMAKNGILIVEFANQLRDQGRDVGAAVVEAGEVRFRPVVMTSVATSFGALPLALAIGPGAEGRAAIGVVVIGGIIGATLLTLFLVPALYRLLAPLTAPRGRIAERLQRLEREGQAAE